MTSPDPLAILSEWSDFFARRDVDGLVALYRDDALFYGSSPDLLRGTAAIRGYFSVLPADGPMSARFYDFVASQVGADGAAIAGWVDFKVGEHALTMRITLTLVQQGGAWRIAMHHAAMPGIPAGTKD